MIYQENVTEILSYTTPTSSITLPKPDEQRKMHTTQADSGDERKRVETTRVKPQSEVHDVA